jgi:hypothetical protein
LGQLTCPGQADFWKFVFVKVMKIASKAQLVNIGIKAIKGWHVSSFNLSSSYCAGSLNGVQAKEIEGYSRHA